MIQAKFHSKSPVASKKNIAIVAAVIISFSAAAAIAFLYPKIEGDLQLHRFPIPKEYTAWNRELKSAPVPHLILRSNSKVKYVFSSADCGIIKHGYKNRVEVFVIFNDLGRIDQVSLGRNIETPAILEKMREQGFFQQWSGHSNYTEPQYVTGATMTGKAISENLAELFKQLKSNNFFRRK